MWNRNSLIGSALLVPMLLLTKPADAQRVRADIRIGGGPISGHIRIGDRYDNYRLRPRVARVEVLRSRDFYRNRGWLKKFRRESRIIVIYRDRRDDFYYDRYRPGLYQTRVYERDGRYYRWDDDRFERWFGDRSYDDDFSYRYNDRYYDDRSYDRRYRDRVRDRRNW